MSRYMTPGVYKEDVFLTPPTALRTGMPAFLGFVKEKRLWALINGPQMITLWNQFEERYGALGSDSYLPQAVRGFFENDGKQCYVILVRLHDSVESTREAFKKGLGKLECLDSIDLLCAPDIMWSFQHDDLNVEAAKALQADVLKYCEEQGDRFAILDSIPEANTKEVLQQRKRLRGDNGALYYPWIKVRVTNEPNSTGVFIPPCGHVAGVISRTDARVGVHKAPANEIIAGAVDLEFRLTNSQQGDLNPEGINCLRAFPGRGIRIWGARTLSSQPAWTYINVRRIFLTAGRWIEHNMADEVFEPHNTFLWKRIERDLSGYLTDLYRQGALKGSTPQEAFFVKCNEETNSSEVRDLGRVVTEIGLAPVVPAEFVIVRIIHSASGVTITGPDRPY